MKRTSLPLRREVAIAALAAGFVAAAALPAAAQGYAAWDEPVGGGFGVSVGVGSPGYYGYAADYPAGSYARSAYAYGPGGCSCAPAAGYGYASYGGGYAYQPSHAVGRGAAASGRAPAAGASDRGEAIGGQGAGQSGMR
jgi:hypothetical protein